MRRNGYRSVPEQELSIEITDINRVHVNYMDILEPRERKISQYFTSKTTGSDDQKLCLVPQEILNLYK